MNVHHIGIETKDIERSRQFYQQLGFQLRARMLLMGEEVIFLTLGDFTLELVEQKTEMVSIPHLCLEVSDIAKSSALLIQKGTPILEGPFLLENGWKTLFFEGPFGETLELLQTIPLSC